MPSAFSNLSLRARLAALVAVTVAALLIALFVAARLARATETFAARRAEASARGAAIDLVRASHEHPAGYGSIQEAVPPRPTHGPHGSPVPPHVTKLFDAYRDPLTRLVAVSLHPFPGTYGGFYRAADGALVGVAYPDYAGTGLDETPPPAVADAVRACALAASGSGEPAFRTVEVGGDRVFVAAYATPDGDTRGVDAAWSASRVTRFSGVGDAANAAAFAALVLALFAVSGLALFTVRDLRRGVGAIESGLAGLTVDLGRRIDPPPPPELARIARAVNGLAEDLRANLDRQRELEGELRRGERLSALGRLVAGVAHEVRNPLAAIKLKLQMARRGGYDPAALDRTFGVIAEEVDRLDGLVRRLLELGRAPRPRLPFDLAALVVRRAELATDVAARRGVRVVAPESEAPVRIDGDEEGLAQVLDNLIANAVEAMPDGGTLTLSCEPNGATARVVVEDTGRGIAPEDRERVFEPFFTGRADGTGLGLAVAREIVDAHEGRIRFEDRESGGTRCVVELPAIEESEETR